MYAEFELAKASGGFVSQRIGRLEDDAARIRVRARDPEVAVGKVLRRKLGAGDFEPAPPLHAIPIIPPA
jgi:hypothetical protein